MGNTNACKLQNVHLMVDGPEIIILQIHAVQEAQLLKGPTRATACWHYGLCEIAFNNYVKSKQLQVMAPGKS